jgi:hypothetical protein
MQAIYWPMLYYRNTAERETGSPMILYHSTFSRKAARGILSNGFKDTTGTHHESGMILTGVKVVMVPYMRPGLRGAMRGTALIEIYLDATEREIDEFEIVTEGSPFRRREWCMPAEFLNSRGAFKIV